jgi:hypothetical protein
LQAELENEKAYKKFLVSQSQCSWCILYGNNTFIKFFSIFMWCLLAIILIWKDYDLKSGFNALAAFITMAIIALASALLNRLGSICKWH